LANNNCNDGIDNDCDGKIDAQDSGCTESPAPPTTFPSDYTAYWKFENNANDETGKYNGAIYGNSAYVAGKKGQALKLDGDDDYMQASYGYNVSPYTVPHTYSLWVKHYATGGNAAPIFLSQSYTSGLGSRMYLSIDSGKWAMGIGLSSSSIRSSTLADNNWHMITLTMNKGTSKMYIDGVDIGYTKLYSAYVFNSYLRLGVYSSTLDYDFAGEIDEAMVYQRALNLTEIQQIYCSQGGSAGFC
jgi:hypothetical protein